MQSVFSKSTAIRQTGFLAQEVEKAAEEAGYNFNGVHKPQDENDNYSLAYAQFVVPLVKGMQEQQRMIETQEQRITQFSQELEELTRGQTATGIGQPGNAEPGFSMEQNIPNPFTNETLIKYNLPANFNSAQMLVYDLTGKQLAAFPIEKNSRSITLSSERLAAGIYIYSIVSDGKIMDSKRMVVSEK